MPSKSIALRIEPSLLEYLEKRAEKEHRTLSNMIVSLILDAKTIPNGRKSVVQIKCGSTNRPACPNCLNPVYRIYDDRLPADFCPYCGQHLVWSEEVDNICFP